MKLCRPNSNPAGGAASMSYQLQKGEFTSGASFQQPLTHSRAGWPQSAPNGLLTIL